MEVKNQWRGNSVCVGDRGSFDFGWYGVMFVLFLNYDKNNENV